MLGRSQPWLVAGAGALWMLSLGVGTLLLVQAGRSSDTTGLSDLARLVALVDLLLLMVGIGLMALSLGRQARAIGQLLEGRSSVDDVLRLVRGFWLVFAGTLVVVSFVGCGTLFTGAAGAVQTFTEQLGGEP